nr:unnamed protein product [Digitaria exilis]
MAKVKPLPPEAAAASPSSSSSQEGEQKPVVYTVWMKSLVFSGNGCTVYGADGCLAYRVDNYGCRGGRESFCMFRRRWEACRCLEDGEETRPWFRVQKIYWKKGGAAAVKMHGHRRRTYTVDGCSRKSDYKISGADGGVVAAIARKQTASGVVLGEDVLTLTVGPEADHLLVLGLVVVCGLMNRCL